MARKPSHPPVVCQYFSWRLFERDGVFYADGRTGKYNLGKHSLGTRDREQALANLRVLDQQKAVELSLASPTSATKGTNVSVIDGWNLFLDYCQRAQVMGGVSPNTFKRYRAVKDKHVTFCQRQGISSWTEVDKASVVKYGNFLYGKEYADRTVCFELNLIKSVVLWLIAEKRLPAACRIELELAKVEGTDTYCYTPAEVKAMVQHCRRRPDLRWLAVVILALTCTGLRISELASLRWTDVDFRSVTILLTDERASRRRKRLGQVRTTKGRRNRALPIHPDFLVVLEDLKCQGTHPDGRIFHGPRGGALKPGTVLNIFIRDVINVLKDRFPAPPGEIGFAQGRLRSFRHYFCSQAFLGGAADADIKDWLGHRESKMVAHYRHMRPGDSLRKMKKIDFLGRDVRTERAGG